MQPSDLKSLETFRWEDKLETADLEKHTDYLRGRHFVALPHPLEATAWENGFVPETHGLRFAGEAKEPGKWPSCPSGRSEKLGQAPPLWKGACLSTRRRMLSGGPKWLIVRGVPRTRPPNRDILGFCVFSGAEGISRAWQKRFVQKRPPLLSKALFEADRPENLGCRLRSPLLTRARQGPWSCRTQQQGRGGR